MYLKSIEIHGFKSFANKITFQFHNGITGIVGPMEAGKQCGRCRPLGAGRAAGEAAARRFHAGRHFFRHGAKKAHGYAYVAITLDNRDHQLAIDYDEVTVAGAFTVRGKANI